MHCPKNPSLISGVTLVVAHCLDTPRDLRRRPDRWLLGPFCDWTRNHDRVLHRLGVVTRALRPKVYVASTANAHFCDNSRFVRQSSKRWDLCTPTRSAGVLASLILALVGCIPSPIWDNGRYSPALFLIPRGSLGRGPSSSMQMGLKYSGEGAGLSPLARRCSRRYSLFRPARIGAPQHSSTESVESSLGGTRSAIGWAAKNDETRTGAFRDRPASENHSCKHNILDT